MCAQTILIMYPLNKFGIVTAELKWVDSYSQFMMAKGRVRTETLGADEGQLSQLATLCDELQPASLYTKYANRKVYRHEADFWQTTETVVRTHVKRMADKRLVKAVELAEAQGIPMLYVTDKKAALNISERLHLDTRHEVTPVMNFRRHDNGTTYRLQLRLGDRIEQNIAELQPVVLTYEPAMFVISSTIYSLSDGFSGKLLLPFEKKAVVEIPRRIENDYFRRFILKHVARAEISAQGFDITDNSLPLQPCLCTKTAVDGSWLLVLCFKYGNLEYTLDIKSNGRVFLTEEDDSFRFYRQLRDKEGESRCLKILISEDNRTTSRGCISFASLEAMIAWLRQHGPTLRAQGFDVMQPSDQVYYIGPLSVEQSSTWQGDWLQTNVTVVVDNGRLRIPFTQLRDTILRGEQDYMLPTGERLLIPREWLQRYSDLLLIGLPKGQALQLHRSQVNVGRQVQDAHQSDSQLDGGKQAPHSTPDDQQATLPVALSNVTLRSYQQAGFRWLWQNLLAQTGCCLSDEMGLGKTLQTIALLLKYKEQAQATTRRQPPPGMLFTESEMQGLTDGDDSTGSPLIPLSYLTSLVVAPASVVHNWYNELARFAPSLKVMAYTGTTAQRHDKRQTLMNSDVVLTTYRTLANDVGYLARLQFGIIVFDESQAFKTPTSQIHHAVSQLNSLHRMALSGTPVENNLGELWSLMNVLNPYLLGDIKQFQQAFVNPIAVQMEESRRSLLRSLIAPYFLKRTKGEVLNDLPERQDEVVVCPMTTSQASRYAEELSRARNEWLDPRSTAQHRLFSMNIALQRLRKIANGEGKMSVVFDHLDTLRSTHHKVLIFSEYVSLLEHVGQQMQQRCWPYALLTGKTRQREQVIEHFQQSADCQFFLISLKAGGIGLNLTSADYVFLLDPWWNRAAEEQAIARAHRIGQHHPVFVYRFVAADTLEEQILTLQDRKQTLIDSVMPFVLGK